jgi:transcriptional regulator with XRE-family HTH domain
MSASPYPNNDFEYTEAMIKMLGDRIKQLRIAKGYPNYEKFAYDHDIARAQFGRYEKGEDLRFSSLLKIVKAFDMSLAEFFSEGFQD